MTENQAKLRIFYAASGPGDLVESHRRWKRHEHNPTEVSITFSSQIQNFCARTGAQCYMLSTHSRREIVTDGNFTIEHRPKPVRHGMRFHLAEIGYGLGLLATALKFRASFALLDSGCTHFFVMALFRLFGIRVVPILHNTLWPSGFPPTRLIPRLVLRLDAFFWKRVPTAAIAVSPECERQIFAVAGQVRYPIFQIRAQFRPEYFAGIPPPPPHERRPFRVMFIGRVERSKGVFDLLEIARRLEDSHPGLVRWEICGRGSDFDELVERHRQLGLGDTVNLRGWTSLDDLVNVYGASHASIVPTRSAFTEGLAMTAAEAILAGRPLVTNPVVPALELLRPACVEAKTDDAGSHMQAVLRLATDGDLYRRLCAACAGLQAQFYDDRRFGLASVLDRVIAGTAGRQRP